MTSVDPTPEPRPVELHVHAMDDLRYIRSAMERAGAFTAVPGWETVLVGLTALAATGLAAHQPTRTLWLAVWAGEALLAAAIGGLGMARKSRRSGTSLTSAPGRKFLLAFCPPAFAGVLLTVALLRTGDPALLPGTWLLMYGAGVVAGGAFSVTAVPLLGIVFLALGAGALFVPAAGDLSLALGFGLAHVVFGVFVARRHGG